MRKNGLFVGSAFLAVGAFLFIKFALPEIKYNKAVKLYQNGKYEKALEAFSEMVKEEYTVTPVFQEMARLIDNRTFAYPALTQAAGECSTLDNYKNAVFFLNSINSVALRETTVDADGNETVTEREYEFDKDGKLLRYSDSSESSDFVEYKYDDEGRLVKILKHYKYDDGDRLSTYEYTYNDNGKPEKETYYYSDGEVYSTTEYSYDRKGNLIKEVEPAAADLNT